ncbi:Zinc finger protein ZPR1 [Astathelohania contejeani]|uniref:Zinc finger protein ZPR1 n=1 Tax=Astathelohania contejeani TaxID=164912 RepID=A0ABQ7HY49_9MICR|nr:Zinc finger protein ZPR1 [Thelohania contejeani]
MNDDDQVPTVSQVICNNCQGIANMTSMRISIPGEPRQCISSTYCENCHFRETSTFHDESKSGIPILITCNFDCKDDLKRYVALYRHAKISIKKDDLEYEYESSIDTSNVVESIIQDAIREISDAYSLQNAREEDHDVNEKVQKLKGLLESGKFKMTIEDMSGLSRVSPVDKKISECEYFDLNTFNDERVEHKNIGSDQI